MNQRDSDLMEPDFDPGQDLRARALAEIQKRREFGAGVLAYVLVNAFLVGIWWLTGHGFFWPMFPIFAWGIGVVFHAWSVYRSEPNEARIRATMDRLSQR